MENKARMFLLAGLALPGHLVDGSLSRRPNQAQLRKDKLGPSSSPLNFCRKVHEVLMQCGLGCSHGRVPPRPKMNQNLVGHVISLGEGA